MSLFPNCRTIFLFLFQGAKSSKAALQTLYPISSVAVFSTIIGTKNRCRKGNDGWSYTDISICILPPVYEHAGVFLFFMCL